VVSAREQALIGPRATEKRREDFVRGRWIAKHLLAAGRPGSRPDDYVILPDTLGAPVVYDDSLTVLPVSLSISHTAGLAAAAVGEEPARVGVDVERLIDEPTAIVEEYFTREERALCSGSGGGAIRARATAIWSVKEALMKAMGEGLRIPAQAVGVTALSEERDGWAKAEVFVRPGDPVPRAWVRMRHDHVLVLAVTGHDGEPPQVEMFGHGAP
jgi:4'-phosphopantetheinyl transferase